MLRFLNGPVQHKRNWNCSTVAQKNHNVDISVTTESAHTTIRLAWHWYSILCMMDMQQLMGTIGKYIHVPQNAKFTQQKQKGNRFETKNYTDKTRNTALTWNTGRWSLQEAVGKNTQKFSDDKHILQEMSPACLSHCPADARPDSSNCNWIANNTTQP